MNGLSGFQKRFSVIPVIGRAAVEIGQRQWDE